MLHLQLKGSLNRPLGYEGVYLPPYQVPGTPFDIQGDENVEQIGFHLVFNETEYQRKVLKLLFKL